MTLLEAAKIALDALDCIYSPLHVREINKVGKAMHALRTAISEAESQSIDQALAAPVQQPKFAKYWAITDIEGKHIKVNAATQRLEIYEEKRFANANLLPDTKFTLVYITATSPVQHPVAYKHVCNLWVDPVTAKYTVDHCDRPPSECIPAYIETVPTAQREWDGFTDEERAAIAMDCFKKKRTWLQALEFLEAKLKEKNT